MSRPRYGMKPVLGPIVRNWREPERPGRIEIEGAYARLEPLESGRHCRELFSAYQEDREGRVWDYLPYGPFDSLAGYTSWVDEAALSNDPLFFAIRDKSSGRAGGVASYLRVKPAQGSIEVGHINLAPALQRTRAGTDAMYQMMKWAFGAGYRRYEWKCNALNIRSRQAAERLGLSYEGVFRQATISKGRNRDTAWFAAIDAEWPALEQAFENWLSAENFDGNGRQRRRLAAMTLPILATRDPILSGQTVPGHDRHGDGLEAH